MSTMRIKYLKQKDGTDKSKRLYSVKYKTYYYVVKDETKEVLTFKIVNDNQKRVVYSNDESLITNKCVLYRAIRDKLESLGVELSSEIRPHQVAPSQEDRRKGISKITKEAIERKKQLKEDGKREESPNVTDE